MQHQGILLELPERQLDAVPEMARGEAKLRTVNRAQKTMAVIDVEELIGPDHKARAIWELAGGLDLSRFSEPIRSMEGKAGAPAWDPRLLVSIWVYAYSEGISSAREIERLMSYEPGLQWLTGLEGINHHTLSDFRVEHRQALDEMFAQLLGLLEAAGLLSLERVMHDGTKIRAQAGADSFRREPTVQEHLERARRLIEQMGDPREDRQGREAAQQRLARERQQRLEQALEQLEQIRAHKETAEQREQARVSLSEPEARIMKHGDQALAPSYNVQLSTDSLQKIIVGVDLTQSSSDGEGLVPAMQEVARNLGRPPAQAVVDGGFTNRDSIVALSEVGIDLIGSLPDPEERSRAAMKAMGIDPAFAPQQFRREAATNTLQCPAGQRLVYLGQSRKRGNVYRQYRAPTGVCAQCAFQPRCCPKNPVGGRTVSVLEAEDARVAAFRRKMQTPEARQIYRQRGEIAEFPNAWIKDKLGLRKFRVRGLGKARMEAVWACFTYNILQWVRLCWRPALLAAAA
jgi:transposase